jgi:galactokinase
VGEISRVEKRVAEQSAFTRTRPCLTSAAPGRVNLMGDHTDYNFGFVLPTPIPQRTRVTLQVRDDDRVLLTSAQHPGEISDYHLGRERRTFSWSDYVQGLTHELVISGMLSKGFALSIESDVPMGAGLSSSAALEVAVLRALREAFELALDDLSLAKVAQRAEVNFVGVPVGIMDQMVASLGTVGAALLIDTRDLTFRAVSIPDELELVVVDSGVTHAHRGGDYRVRRRQCEDAAGQLGLTSLRELDRDHMADLSVLDATLTRRVRHVYSENARVLEMARALEALDRANLSALFRASHASLRDDFAVSTPELDLLVQLAEAQEGLLGARLTGGGFGGSVVMLAERGQGANAALRVCRCYQERTRKHARLLVPVHASEPRH